MNCRICTCSCRMMLYWQHSGSTLYRKRPLWQHSRIFCSSDAQTRTSVTGHAATDKALNTLTQGRIGGWMQMYEDAVGLTEVKEAQNNVMEAEKNFLKAQEDRRQKQHELGVVQTRLKEISAEREKTNRIEQKYLELLQEEHTAIRKENELLEEVKMQEKAERDQFSYLSAALRDSHEKERARAEKTKYWSIIGSITGAVIGIVGTTINNYVRMTKLTKIVSGSAETSEEYKNLTNKCLEALKEQQTIQISRAAPRVGEGQQSVEDSNRDIVIKETNKLLNIMKQQQTDIDKELKDLRSAFSATVTTEGDKGVLLIGNEMETLIKNSEDNLGRRLRLNTFLTVTLVYGAMAVTLPLVYFMFKGS